MDKFKNRKQAGQVLANQLTEYKNKANTIVLALPRGGVPVAFEIAQDLNLPLDVLLVRKLGVPGQEEFALGAIAIDGVCFINKEIVFQLNISNSEIEEIIKKEENELVRRNERYRHNKAFPPLIGKTVLLVDDGIATGATIRAAIEVLKEKKADKIIIATPVMAKDTYKALSHLVDDIVCPLRPEHFIAVGLWYTLFPQTSDEEVCELLNRLQTRSNSGF